MKTLEQAMQYKSQALDGRDIHRLALFVPKNDLAKIGVELKPDFQGEWKPLPWTRENVLAQLKEDVAFGFHKALDRRGLSSHAMYAVVGMWNWILEQGLEGFDGYAQYGLPLFRATAVKYGFPNPIGEEAGNEHHFSSEFEMELAERPTKLCD